MYVGTGLLLLLVCFYLNSRHTSVSREKESAEDRELSRQWRRLDRQERRRELYATYQQPWPWWFLGPCLVFAGLCVVAGIAGYPDPDANVLLVLGPIFLLAFTFKAFAQEQARQARLPEPPAQLLPRVSRASSSRCLPVSPHARPIDPLSTASHSPLLPRRLPLPESSCHPSKGRLMLHRTLPHQDAQAI